MHLYSQNKPALLKNSVSYVKEITLLTFIFAASFIIWFTNIRPIPFPAYVCETTKDRTSARSSPHTCKPATPTISPLLS